MLSRRPSLTLLVGTALALCSCSRNSDSQQTATDQTASGPNISPTAAPGVAFNYAYHFNLPDERISATQEAHAAACERLGAARCRITGMSYSVDEDEQVTAELDLKLDPILARQFGKSAQTLVENNDGKLVRLEIGSSDEGAAINQAARQKGETSAQLSQLQTELAKTKPGTSARASLLSQIEGLQQQASQQSQAITTSQVTLASTPMALHYYGRGGVPGFRGNPVREAWHTFVTTIVWIVGALLQAATILIPIAVLIGLFIALWRTPPVRLLRRWIRGPEDLEG
jgi:hypothetical protein